MLITSAKNIHKYFLHVNDSRKGSLRNYNIPFRTKVIYFQSIIEADFCGVADY